MFRKPKRSGKKAGRRRKQTDDEEEEENTQEVQQALKRAKHEQTSSKQNVSDEKNNNNGSQTTLHQYEEASDSLPSQKDLATATTQHHPKEMEGISKSKVDPKRNKFLAGPIRAPTNIRTTCRFDYQPDICKDYKDTGFCGFGDTCIYLHDRGDTMSGWQLEKAWEEKQRTKKEQQEAQMERFMKALDDPNSSGKKEKDTTSTPLQLEDDGLPFACFLCRKAFEDPVVTTCGHYFCQGCLQDQQQAARSSGDKNHQACPICGRDTHGVMNPPTKLVAKKRKLLGRTATWKDFSESKGGIVERD